MPIKRKTYTSYSAKPCKKSKLYTRQNSFKTLLVPSRYAVAPKKVELKYRDENYSVAPATSTVALLTKIANGTGPSDRIGRHVQYMNMTVNLFHQLTTGYNTTRFIVVYDRQTNAAQPAVTDILNSSTDPHALYNPDNRSRFKILCDKVYNLDSNNVGTYCVNNINISLKGLRAEFLGSTNAVTDIDMGGLFAVHLNSNGTTLTTYLRSRFQYFD